ncbi:hypothetical protein I1E95_13685 [Synechococcus sp. CBW1107]|uniref:hypothetical protein n=1 Tax=Synechococcus sp. CBW1107 TaxID=2789857 RepID=UPI0018CEB0F9|nr:hypothetical protein [Synechococcus sp. CBW1107]QPN56147.1 hypothetical protein I1E95_13685 [Synechococcus sp. CBW1107]
MKARLLLGPVHVCPQVREWLDLETLQRLVSRHRRGDWGEVDARDARANTLAAYHQCGRLRSVYNLGQGLCIWVITDHLGTDSLQTTVLIPADE